MFKVTFHNLNYGFDAKNDAQNDVQNDAQNNIEAIIISLIRKKPKITRQEMAEYVGKSKPTIERLLRKSTKIKYVGSGKHGHLEVKE